MEHVALVISIIGGACGIIVTVLGASWALANRFSRVERKVDVVCERVEGLREDQSKTESDIKRLYESRNQHAAAIARMQGSQPSLKPRR